MAFAQRSVSTGRAHLFREALAASVRRLMLLSMPCDRSRSPLISRSMPASRPFSSVSLCSRQKRGKGQGNSTFYPQLRLPLQPAPKGNGCESERAPSTQTKHTSNSLAGRKRALFIHENRNLIDACEISLSLSLSSFPFKRLSVPPRLCLLIKSKTLEWRGLARGGPHRLRLAQLCLQRRALGLVLDLVGADGKQVGGAHGGHAGGAGAGVVPGRPHHVLRVGRQQPLHAPVLAQEALGV